MYLTLFFGDETGNPYYLVWPMMRQVFKVNYCSLCHFNSIFNKAMHELVDDKYITNFGVALY